jgi:hypothetical protein
MSCLLAARGRCVVHRHRSRRIDDYVFGQLLGRLMRHLGLVSVEIALMPDGMMGATRLALLVPPRRRSQRRPSRRLATTDRAVPIAPVTPPAQEENLPAARACDETQ